jgi:predicted nucleotidyltransferase
MLPAMKPSEAFAAHRTELRELFLRHGLERPRVYGSVLSGADTEESDLDLLADAAETTTLFMLARLEYAAQELLGVPVSILTPGFLPDKFRGRVLELAQPL